MASLRLVLVLATACACGHGGATQPPPERHDASTRPADAALELPSRPLGLSQLADFAWRKRSGQPAYRLARKAEARGDWQAVATSTQAALAADPGHLEAAWLEAVAFAKLGKLDDVLAPLQLAISGDFAKWGAASLEQPALQPWLATPTGQAWRRRIERDRETYVAGLVHAIMVTAGGDLYAFDPEASRWSRLTHSFGGVVAAFAGPRRLAYVVRGRAQGASAPKLSVGLVDLASGRSFHALALGAQAPLSITYSTAPPTGFWIGGAGAAPWHLLDDDGVALHAMPAKSTRPRGLWLEVLAHSARLHRLPIAGVSADWDEQSLASAIRVGASDRVVAVPSPGLIDGNTVTWSADRAHLAFVAQLDDHCTPGAATAAAFVADAATGAVHELERASGGLAIEWVSERRLAIAGDHGVSLVELGASVATPLVGADGLLSPRRKPRCTPEPVEEPSTDEPED